MLTKHTLGKIQIFGHDSAKWEKAIFELIPPDQIPKHWGGTREGNDEFCSSLICMGGTVPSKYLRNGSTSDDNENDDLITVTVGASDKLDVQYEVLYNNSTIRLYSIYKLYVS